MLLPKSSASRQMRHVSVVAGLDAFPTYGAPTKTPMADKTGDEAVRKMVDGPAVQTEGPGGHQ